MSLTISQLIDQIREDLLTPRAANTPEEMYPFLFIDEVEVEINFKISTQVEGSGKITFQVVEIGSSVGTADEQVHRMKVKLSPLLSKQEHRDFLEERVGPIVMKKITDTSLKATAKDF